MGNEKQNIFEERLNRIIRLFLYGLVVSIPIGNAPIENCVAFAMFFWVIKRSGRAILDFQNQAPQKIFQKLKLVLKNFKPPVTFLNPYIYLFLFFGFVSCFLGIMPLESIGKFFTKIFQWFLILWLVIESFSKKEHLRLALLVLTFSVVITSFDGIYQFFVHKNLLGIPLQEGFRVTSTFKVAVGYGAYLAFSLPLICGFLFSKVKKDYEKLPFRSFAIAKVLILSVILVVLVLTFCRGAWISLFIGCLIFLFYIFMRKSVKYSVRILVLLFICLGILTSFYYVKKDANFKYLKDTGTFNVRVRIWEDTLASIKNRPFFGYGINTYMRKFQDIRRDPQFNPTYAHNSYLQLLFETGIFGFTAFILLIFKFFKTSFHIFLKHCIGNREWEFLIGGCLVGLIMFHLHSFVDNHFYSLRLSIMWWLVMGLSVAFLQIINLKTAEKGHK